MDPERTTCMFRNMPPGEEQESTADNEDEHASSPILASSLGLNQIRMRSSPLSPQRFLLPSRTEPESSYADSDREQHPRHIANKGKVFSLTHAKSLKFSPSLSRGSEPHNAAVPKEMHSPRFQAILRLTSGRKKRAPDIKSFSHELNSKGVRPIPFWKSRAVGHIEEIMVVIRAKFERLKEEVNSDLGVFAGDLVSTLEKNPEFHPEWKEILEDLLVIARYCAKMIPTEFWAKCENIVQNLDDRRQVLPMGILKKAHTRLLFILTRCTRLVQFQKESGYEDDNVLGLHKLSDLGVYPERSTQTVAALGEKHKHSQHCEQDHSKQSEFGHIKGIGQFDKGSEKNVEPITNSYKMSSWKKLPSPAERKPLRDFDGVSTPSSDNSDQLLVKDLPTICLGDLIQNIDASISPEDSGVETSIEMAEKPIWDQQNSSCQVSMICRICEVEIPTMQIEDHSRICTVADRCDLKGLSVDERLQRVVKALERIHLAFISRRSHDPVAGNSCHKVITPNAIEDLTELSSPNKYSLIRHCSIDMADCVPDNDNLFGAYDFNTSSDMSCEECSGQMSDIVSKSSSIESLTPRSPLLETRSNQMEILWSWPKQILEYENFKEMVKLMDIVQAVSNINHPNYNALECMLHYLEELKLIIQGRKVDALVVGTFGRRIENLLQEKYVRLCGKMEDDNMVSPTVADEDSSPEDYSHNIRASPINWCSKDRTSIEDFEIIKPVSRGAFGRVFLARKRATGDLFAIKVLKKVDTICKNAVESILAERNILITVRNPFVVRFFYSFTCRENLYLVMEYLNGGDLFSLLRNLGCLEEDMARTYIAEVILALEYLHSLNIIHRDLKPDNLLLGPDGHVKLTDFGLSKVGLINSTDDLSGPTVSDTGFGVDESETGTRHQLPRGRHRQKQSVVGTPDYLAPEILLGMGHGATADWWSVGIILFELLVGFPPFNAEHPQKIFDNIMNRDIPWPKIPEELSHDAYDLIDRLLTENPGQRLGATGAKEVKQHPFLKNVNWDTLARQKATFIPSPEGAEDTSYFMSRYIWNPEDGRVQRGSDFEDMDETASISSSSSSSFSNIDEDDDECSSLADFNVPPLDSTYSFSNFSFKNLSQLASINYDYLMKSSQDPPPAS